MSTRPRPLADRLFEKVTPGPNGCWIYTGAKDRDGYGVFQLNRTTTRRAHRVSYELTYGAIPDGYVVMHECDMPSCFRPDHLSVGTYADNRQDCVDKARAVNQHTLKTHCVRGHEFALHGRFYGPDNAWRRCLVCKKDSRK